MKIRACEDSIAYSNALAVIHGSKPSTNYTDMVLSHREMGVLSTISDDYRRGDVTNHYALLIFGGGHNFSKCVETWNEKHDFKFSLVIVTPVSYDHL